MRRSTRRRAFHPAPMPGAGGRRSQADSLDIADIAAVMRAVNRARKGGSVAAEDAMQLALLAERLGDIAGMLSQVIGQILDSVESGDSLAPEAIAFYRELSIIPAGPLFEEIA